MYPPQLLRLACVAAITWSSVVAQPSAVASQIVGWGDNSLGQSSVPPDITNGVAISAGGGHSAVLNANGTVSVFGFGDYGQKLVPSGLVNAIGISAGYDHTLAVGSDGVIYAWGRDNFGQTEIPAGLNNVAAVSANEYYSMALKADGTVVAWGHNEWGQTTVPAGLNNVVAISAGGFHALVLKSDGTVAAWGKNNFGQINPPAGLNNVVAISAGGEHNLALRRDGTVVAWGSNNLGQTNIPPNLRPIIAIAAGDAHNLLLQDDGTVVAWGWNDNGQAVVPPGLANVRAISGGFVFSLALVQDGSTPPTPLHITCPPDHILPCAQCNTDPSVTGTPEVSGEAPITVSHTDVVSGSCPQVLTRTWTASNNTSSQSCVQTITCVPPTLMSLVTSSSGCTFDLDPSTPISDFRLLFTLDPKHAPCLKLSESNPGQFSYNIFANGVPGQTLAFNITIPYPFVTSGSTPFRAYDWVTIQTGSQAATSAVTAAGESEEDDDDDHDTTTPGTGGICLVPGNPIFYGSSRVTLSTYGDNPFTTVTVRVKVPESGFVYLVARLDYGLKGHSGYTRNLAGDAMDCATGTQVMIPNHGTYPFSVGGDQIDSTEIANVNVFKQNPGVAGLVLTQDGHSPVPGTEVKLMTGRGTVVGADKTDADGFYVIVYKHTGKAATYRVSIKTPGGYTSSKSVTLKANSFVELDFLTTGF